MNLNEDVSKYYQHGSEKDRLLKDEFGDLERIRTLDILDRYLPEN
jgi:hypothetical protein